MGRRHAVMATDYQRTSHYIVRYGVSFGVFSGFRVFKYYFRLPKGVVVRRQLKQRYAREALTYFGVGVLVILLAAFIEVFFTPAFIGLLSLVIGG